jgi:hypothetical protein
MVGLRVNLCETRALQLLPNCARKNGRVCRSDGWKQSNMVAANLLAAVAMGWGEVCDRNRRDKNAALKFGHIPTTAARYSTELNYELYTKHEAEGL